MANGIAYRFGVFEFDADAGELRRQGRIVRLPPQPARLLARLVEQPGVLLTRDALCRDIWPEDLHVGFDNGLNFCVNQVRRALGDSAVGARYVETVPRRGYRFIAPVEHVQTPPNVALAPPTAEPDLIDGAQPIATPARRRHGWTTLLVAVIVAPVGALLVSRGPEGAARTSPGALRRAGPAVENVAFDPYLKGLQRLTAAGPDAAREAARWLHDAAARVPNEPRIEVALAEALIRTGDAAGAVAAANRAIAVDASNAAAYAARSRAFVQQWNWRAARADLERALALAPGVAAHHEQAAMFMATQARPDEAVGEMMAALAIDPLSTSINGDVGWYQLLAHRPDEALRYCGRAIELDPKASGAWACMFEAYVQKGLEPQAFDARLVQMKRSGAPAARLTAARRVFAAEGLRGWLRREADAVARGGADDFTIAIARARAGDVVGALDRLERLYAARSRTLASLHATPAFDILRGDPRYRALLAAVGLPSS